MIIIAVSVILFGAIPNVESGGVRVKGPLGGNASVHCSYKKGSENHPKYFRKGKVDIQIVRLDRGVMWAQNSRFSLEDDKENREFIVTIRNLSVEDAGLYWCGVDTWLWDVQTEVNLDVVQDAATESVFVTQTTSPATVTRQRTIEAQEQQRDKSVRLRVSLAAVVGTLVLLCATASVLYFIMKNNKAKAASTRSEKLTEPEDNCVHYKVISTNSTSVVTTQSPDSIIYATPSSRCRTCSPPSHCDPAAIWSCSGETQHQCLEAVVYSDISQSQTCPGSQSDAALSTSTQSFSLHYSKLYFGQRSHVLSDTSAFSEESHDVYANVHH